MTDKDKITFAIRYLKKGLKSKRTPPLYEELMKELGFVSEKDLGKVEGKLADLTSEYYELENLKNNEIAELKEEIKNNEDLATVTYMQGAENQKKKADKQLTKAKELIRQLCLMVRELNKPNVQLTNVDYSLAEAEQFLSEVEK